MSSALVGTWDLESQEERSADGVVHAQSNLGEYPVGRLFYDSRGHVSAQLMRCDRSAAGAISVRPGGTNSPTSFDGYVAYFGTYTVDPVAKTITHHLEGAPAASDVGKSLTRHFDLDGNTLRLSFETRAADGTTVTHVLVWQRVS